MAQCKPTPPEVERERIDLREKITCVMFDLDGTLVDSVPGYYQLMEDILKAVGLPPAPRPLVAEFMTGGLGVLEKMIPPEMAHRKEELVRACITVGRRLSGDMFRSRVQLFPGVRNLFTLLTHLGIPMGVVTSTERRNIDRKMVPLERDGIKDALATVIAIEDAPRKKPAPDPLIACAQRLAVKPQQCIYIGDSHIDIRAGNAAGMLTAGVLTGLDDRETLKQEKPTMILDSVADLCDLFS
jgi:2-phosphoglycolate phosphatase